MRKVRARGVHGKAASTERIHLTDRRILAMPIPEKTTKVYDAKSSLGLRLTAQGKRTFFWNHAVRGVPVWRGIGEHPVISLEVARDKSREYDGMLATWRKEGFKGVNPFALPDDAGVLTLARAAELYIDRHLALHSKNPEAAAKDVRDTLTRYCPDWKARPLGEITRPMCLELHARLGKGIGLTRRKRHKSEVGRTSANRLLDILRTIYKFCLDNELYNGPNPARLRAKERFPEPARVRCLSPEELTRLLAAINDKRTIPDLRDFVLLSLATGQRKKTVMRSRWDAIDLKSQTWTLREDETKNKKPLTVELTTVATRVLRQRLADRLPGAPYVFSGQDNTKPRFDFNQTTWRNLLKRAELDYPRSSPLNFRGHDLRHTAISYAVMAGRSLEQVGGFVGHASVKSTQRYAHLAQGVKRETAIAGEREMARRIEAAKKQLPASR